MDRTAVPEYARHLNPQQLEAVRHHGRPLLILAGAGSGKTRVITVKIAYLIDELGVDPHSILAVTFTNKAAAEMRTRAAGMVPSAAEVFIRTFHSFGAWLLRRNAHLAGLPSGFSIYDEEDSLALLKTLYPEYHRGLLRSYGRRISRAKDYCLGPDDDLSGISSDPSFPSHYSSYESRLREIGNVDFGDLIMLPVRLLAYEPAVAARIRSRFRYILVDEYQDSNVAQYELLKHMTDEGTYLCVVGDDDQSIYRFRGAEVRNILSFQESFPGTTVIRLEENYRSTEPILDVASSVVSRNSGRLGKRLWTRRSGGVKPQIVRLEDQDEEVDYCLRLLRMGGTGNTAILYRTNAQSRLFETAFIRHEVPYRIVGTLRFWEREEVKDAVALLKFFANRRDEVSFRRIVNKPTRGIGAATVEKLLGPCSEGETDIVRACELALERLGSRARKASEGFLELIRELEGSYDGSSLGGFVERVVSRSGLAEFHREQDEVAGSQKIQNLEELVNAASLYSASEEGLREFLEAIELDSSREQSRAADEEDAVTLITMHNTKGLEFDRVIVTGLEEGVFPRGNDEDPEELEEERRLFYVSITRARDELYLTSCATRRIYGRVTQVSPSRFLQEIPEEAVDVYGDLKPGHADAEETWPRGTIVYHDDYGTGVIVQSWNDGGHEVVTVRFENGRTARFLPEFATLERVSQDA